MSLLRQSHFFPTISAFVELLGCRTYGIPIIPTKIYVGAMGSATPPTCHYSDNPQFLLLSKFWDVGVMGFPLLRQSHFSDNFSSCRSIGISELWDSHYSDNPISPTISAPVEILGCRSSETSDVVEPT